MFDERRTQGEQRPKHGDAGRRRRQPDSSGSLAHLERAIAEARRLGAAGDPTVQNLLRAHAMDPANVGVQALLANALRPHQLRSFLNPDPFLANLPAAQDAFPGDVVLARLQNGLEWAIRPADLCRHFLVVGASGAGKTNLILQLVRQILSDR